jgi:DNA-binding transcriptional ArsR family regulator
MLFYMWSVIADPKRREILGLLREKPRPVGKIVDHLGISQPGTSKHLRVLREAGLVKVERRGQQRMYVLDPAPLAEIDAWLAPYRQLWDRRLDALGRHLDRAAK